MKKEITNLRFKVCIICKINPKRSKKAKTCCQSCAAKLAWKTRLSAL